MPGDLQGLIADPQFQSLSPVDKRAAMQGVSGDKAFSGLSDGDTMQFVSHMADRIRLTRPDLAAPPSVPRPQASMQQSALGSIDSSEPGQLPFGGMHGGSYDIAPRGESGQIVPPNDPRMKAAALGGTMGVAASPYAIPAAVGAAKAAPYIGAGAAIDYARKNLPLGKYIPPGAEMLPMFIGGSKLATKTAAKEAAGTAAAEAAEGAEATGARVPVGKFAKEVPNPDPYRFKGAPDSMDIAQSTNVGKVGYEPDSRTMTVEYKSGQVYSYHGVPQEIYKDAQDADSIGSYISRNIKGRYETVRRGSVLVKKR